MLDEMTHVLCDVLEHAFELIGMAHQVHSCLVLSILVDCLNSAPLKN